MRLVLTFVISTMLLVPGLRFADAVLLAYRPLRVTLLSICLSSNDWWLGRTRETLAS